MSHRKSALKPQFPAKVCASRCKTCIFGPNTPLPRERFAELAKGWAKMRGGHQVCHQHGTSEGGEDVYCRGFWDTQIPEADRVSFEARGYGTFVPSEPPERADDLAPERE